MWYLLQITVVFTIVYVYTNVIPSENVALGHIYVFAILLSYGLTWILSKIHDLLILVSNWKRLPSKDTCTQRRITLSRKRLNH
jgi:hypothetical protein